jgi:hypothetical protein
MEWNRKLMNINKLYREERKINLPPFPKRPKVLFHVGDTVYCTSLKKWAKIEKKLVNDRIEISYIGKNQRRVPVVVHLEELQTEKEHGE